MRNKLKHIALIINILFILFQLQACTAVHETSSTNTSEDTFIAAVVVNKTGFDGCGFLLRIGETDLYEPNGLQEEFRMNDLKVWIKYELDPRPSICMVGKTITIIDCKLRE